MTEHEWLTCTNPTPMLQFLQGKAGQRELRLFGAACCRRVSYLFTEVSRQAIEISERYADGRANPAEFADAGLLADLECCGTPTFPDPSGAYGFGRRDQCQNRAAHVARIVTQADLSIQDLSRVSEELALTIKLNGTSLESWFGWGKAPRAHAGFLRCIFGMAPFRAGYVDSSWRTSTVMALANPIFEERAFDRLPILADALEDAGCTNADILNHCRGPERHVLGCWPLDLILGKR